MDYQTIIDFWFIETQPDSWWKKDPTFDQTIRNQFLSVHQAAVKCELYIWRNEPLGRLAEIIVLDQFSRNMYRGTKEAFCSDPMALALAQEAIARNNQQDLPTIQRLFLYMPFMHSESVIIHEQAVKLFSEPGLEMNLEYEMKHKAIIDRFGRYPHRNAILKRNSTAEELAFLKGPDSSF